MLTFAIACLLLAKVTVAEKAVELNSANVCTVCVCERSEIICNENLQQKKLILYSLDSSWKRIIIQDFEHVLIKSGAFEIANDFRIQIQNAESFTAEAKAMSLQDDLSNLTLTVTHVKKLEFNPKSVSGNAGNFAIFVANANEVFLAPHTFDVLSRVEIRDTHFVQVSPTAFKSKALGQLPNVHVILHNISSIPSLSSNAFSSAASINLSRCWIKEIASNAFHGIHIESINFNFCTVDRIHPGAFPSITLISTLSFVDCNLTSISEHAIQSAVSHLSVTGSQIASMSSSGIDCQAAKVALVDNSFQTLVSGSMSLRSWNDFRMVGNTMNFIDEGALAGINNPGTDVNVTFVFVDNVIAYANRRALQVNLPNSTKFVVEGNVFQKECECEFDVWIDALSSGEKTQMDELLKNSSLCRVPKFLSDCFSGNPHVLLPLYVDQVCIRNNFKEDGKCGRSSIWSVVEDQVEIHTNKGILLIILFAAIIFSLLVSIYTLIRWIVFTIQMRRYDKKNVDEWNFTKIEERRHDDKPSPIDHYERLPLAKDDDVTEEHSDKKELLDSASSKDVKIVTTKETKRKSQIEPLKSNEATNETAQANLTFYDEMIDLLKEKLDDPENYATVADTKTSCLYENPFDKGEAT